MTDHLPSPLEENINLTFFCLQKVSISDLGNELFKFPGCSHLLPGLIQDNNTMCVELLTIYQY